MCGHGQFAYGQRRRVPNIVLNLKSAFFKLQCLYCSCELSFLKGSHKHEEATLVLRNEANMEAPKLAVPQMAT